MKAVLTSALLALSGCATMIQGTSQEVSLTSEPAGAQVTFRDQHCITPCVVQAARSSRPAMIRFEMAERETYFGEISSHEMTVADDPAIATVSILGALLVVPGIVDLSSDAFYDWPTAIHAVLPAKGSGGAMLDVKRRRN